MAERAYVGTSGWVYEHWRGVFYPPELPQARWLGHYAGRLRTVEINNTFYRLPEAATFREWRRQAPAGFVYAVKASRYLTHLKKLKDPAEPLARLLERARELGGHLGPILYQLPPNWRLNLARLEAFLQLLPTGILHAFEFRHPSWFAGEALDLLDRYGAGLCLADLPGLEGPLRPTGRLVYVRLHGPRRAYEGSYSEQELAEWAGRVRGFLAAGRPVYVYFNNDAHGHAVQNALRLQEMLGS
jgi:uncharacterized protein YecE (DUF72 family)